MFELNETYTNRIGTYVVKSIDGPKMTVQYEDGTSATLRMDIQYRIWENILVEREAAEAKAIKKTRKKVVSQTRHFIKTVTVDEEELAIPGLKRRICAIMPDAGLKVGDRLIYFAPELEVFFAVVTLTGEPKKAKAIDYGFGSDKKAKVLLYAIDIDGQIFALENAVSAETVELESMPEHSDKLRMPNQFLPVSEDDFELLAELIVEIDTEIDEDEVDEDEEEAADPDEMAEPLIED